MNIQKKTHSFTYGGHTVTLETGAIARQATGSVMVKMGNTILLCTVVAKDKAVEGQDFFPLTVNYQEKTSSAGKIPGGFLKREGRPSEIETLTSRLIDRPIRPLFPKEFTNEVQIIVTLYSLDPNISPDIPALLGASAALSISGVPFKGPIAAARVGYANNNYTLNPSHEALKDSALDLIVAGTKDAVLMVESEAKELPEDVMLNAVMYGHEQMQVAIQAIEEFVADAGKTKWDWQAPAKQSDLIEKIKTECTSSLQQAFNIKDKSERQVKRHEIYNTLLEGLNLNNESSMSEDTVSKCFHSFEAEIMRNQVLETSIRIDGRDTKTVRPISIDLGVLPHAHGSAIFTRGETQAIVTTTLGTDKDSQIHDDLLEETRSRFMLHYNFPPFCVGETGFMSGPKRREIGHGKLAKRALTAIMPDEADCPYVIRIISDITESNGSSSMATVCGGCLSLMDAGMPIKAPVAGIAMGLIKEGDKFVVLTDILGDEDHLGDMDFKVAGTEYGISALQMDIKIEGITREIMQQALEQARQGRLHILDIMKQAIARPREDVSEFAPRIISIKINPDKIRDVIGKGGATIRDLTESTETIIDISDDGTIKIAACDKEKANLAKKRIEEITAEAEVGLTYEGKVVKIMDFGAFVAILPGKEGLVHISQICNERVENVNDHLSEGQIVRVKLIEIDKQGRLKLSMKQADPQEIAEKV